MSIELKGMIGYIKKAAMYDAIMNYIRATEYISKDDILAFVGEKGEEVETNDE